MDLKLYRQIQSYCRKRLFRNLHQRHLEDLTQYMAMEIWRRQGDKNLRWHNVFVDYLRFNGVSLGIRGKSGARALENTQWNYDWPISAEEIVEKFTKEDIFEKLLTLMGVNKEGVKWGAKILSKTWKLKQIQGLEGW